MKKLTPAQEKTLSKIRKAIQRQPEHHRTRPLPVAMRWKDSWCKNWASEGLNVNTLKALDKKGVIKLHVNHTRETGVFNPRADSWGYSSSTLEYTAEVL